MTLAPCRKPACSGRVLDDGYCDTCGARPTTEPAPFSSDRPHAKRGQRPQREMAPTLPAGSACPQIGCNGTTLDDGYCDTCGVRAEIHDRPSKIRADWPHVARSSDSSGTPKTMRVRTGATKSKGVISGAVGGGLVEVPAIVGLPAEAAVVDDPVVPESERFCSNAECGRPVGRSRDEHEGRRTGHCPACGQWYSFEATLRIGELLGGQYEILGPIGHGGRGWVYVGRDRNVADRPVVVKGLLNAGDADAAAEAAAEMHYLASVEHEYIVKIYNFVADEDGAYIVMEYVEGTSLEALLEAQHAGGELDDEWIERSLAYVVAVLEALEYLHQNQIAYNDMKPENVMAVGSGCKVIDLGAAHRIADRASGILATPGFYAPELPETGPTVVTDLYTVGRTILALTEPDFDLRDSSGKPPPSPEDVPTLARNESLYRVVLRATDLDPDARFQSSSEMRGQLLGVLRELVATSEAKPRPSVSELFTPELETGSADPRWQTLPAPRPTDRDPAVAFVASLGPLPPKEVLEQLGVVLRSGQLPDTIDTWSQVLRVCLEARAMRFAADHLTDLEAEAPGDWRLAWHRGLLALANGEPDAALSWLDQVYLAFPGEQATKLAVAVASEHAGDPVRAAHLYDIVSRVDPSFTSAVFGLARCLMANGEVEEAVRSLDRLPATSRAWAAGRMTAVRLLLDSLRDVRSGIAPTTDVATKRLQEAGTIVADEPLDPEQRARLEREVFDTGLALIESKRVVPHRKVMLLGRSLTTDGMRRGLEGSYRELARFTTSARERVELIDLANFFRPTSVR